MELLVAVVAGFDARMRVGSIEILAALLVVAVVAARPRVRPAAEAGRLSPMRVRFEIFERGGSRSFEGRPPFEVGRAHGAELVLRDAEVSRRHVRFESRSGIVYVDDLGSRNGTFLNGSRLHDALELRAGDAVDVGTTRMIVESIEPWT
ncbi:MAG: FHA domain-containing protein [Candidatus Eremiobacteraeota bacterium]|nr:FHA domain-containing protein [Candidatus Eremiobacteraeota bacterium]